MKKKYLMLTIFFIIIILCGCSNNNKVCKELEDRYQNYDNINGVKYKIKQNYDNIVVNLEIEVNDDTKSVNFYLPFSLNDDINSITQKISNCK